MSTQITLSKKIYLSRRYLWWVVLLATGLLVSWLLRSPLFDFLGWVGDRQAVVSSIQHFGVWGPVVLSLLLVLQVFLAVIPGHALIFAGGYIYGFAFSLLITLSSTVLGSQVAFLIARRYGRGVIFRLADPQVIRRWERLSCLHGGLFYFFAFVLPIFPSDLMCYVAGLSKISSPRFLVSNFMGRLVCTAFITLIGSNGLQLPAAFWIAAALGLGALYGAWRLYLKRSKSFQLDSLTFGR